MAPALYTNVKITLFFDDDNLIVTSTDPRFDPLTRTIDVRLDELDVPVVVQVSARDHTSHWGANLDDKRLDALDLPRRHERRPELHRTSSAPGSSTSTSATTPTATWSGSDGHGWLDDFGWHNVGLGLGQHGWATRWGFWGADHAWHPFPHQVPRVDVNILRPDEDVRVRRRVRRLDARRDRRPERRHVHDPADRGARTDDESWWCSFESDGQTIGVRRMRLRPALRARRLPHTARPSRSTRRTGGCPFTVRLTSNPGAPPTDPYQPIQVFPDALRTSASSRRAATTNDFDLVGGIRFGNGWFGWARRARLGRRPRLVRRPQLVRRHGWFDGHDGWWFDGDGWFDGHSWHVDTEPSLHSLLCNDGDPDHWHHGSWGGWGWGGGAWGWNGAFGCEDMPARQPVILPNEQGAGPPPEFTSVSCDLVVEATSPAGATVTYDPAHARTARSAPATLSYSQASGTIFPIGTTVVTIRAIDEGGNYQYATFKITVRDTTRAGDHDLEPEPDGRGDERRRRGRDVRSGDRDRCGRPGDDHLLEGIGRDVRDRDDDGDRDGDRRLRQPLLEDVHRDGAGHDGAGDHGSEHDGRGDAVDGLEGRDVHLDGDGCGRRDVADVLEDRPARCSVRHDVGDRDGEGCGRATRRRRRSR